jgi:hypothetical protein
VSLSASIAPEIEYLEYFIRSRTAHTFTAGEASDNGILPTDMDVDEEEPTGRLRPPLVLHEHTGLLGTNYICMSRILLAQLL